MKELDTMWFQAQHDAIKAGEDFTRYRFAALVAAAEREKVAHWMSSMGYATGHGDTVEDLLGELRTQIAERLLMEREACAKECDAVSASADKSAVNGQYLIIRNGAEARRCAAAIRARGNK